MKKILDILSYPRSLLVTILYVFATIFYCILAVFAGTFVKVRRFHDFIFHSWSRIFLFLYNIKLVVHNKEKLPDEGVLYLFNHSSLVDIPIVHSAIPKSIRFGAKSELFKIPLFGRAINSLKILKITRGDREKVLRLYQESIPNVKSGISYVLAPEGGRHVKGGIGKFRTGPFIFSISGEFPMCPIVLKGASNVLKKGHFLPNWGSWSTRVDVYVLDTYPTKGRTLEEIDQIKTDIHQAMSQVYSD